MNQLTVKEKLSLIEMLKSADPETLNLAFSIIDNSKYIRKSELLTWYIKDKLSNYVWYSNLNGNRGMWYGYSEARYLNEDLILRLYDKYCINKVQIDFRR